jgi:hypothetical protein
LNAMRQQDCVATDIFDKTRQTIPTICRVG